MKHRRAVSLVAGVAAVFIVVAKGRADPKLGTVPPHRHYIKTATGDLVDVGPRVCDDPNLQRAFNQFHNNIHMVTASGIGPAAPGLHKIGDPRLMAGPCAAR